MKKITLTEELALKAGFKNLRGLKLSISRKLGKGTYNKENNEIDIIKFITVIASRASADFIEELLNSDKEIDTKIVMDKVDKKIEEIEIRTGVFYCSCDNSYNIRCDEKGGIIAQLYHSGEITKEELIQTCMDFNIDLDINFKELETGESKNRFGGDIDNSYRHYDSSTNADYISIFDRELDYANVIECKWEKNELDRQDYVEQAKLETFVRDNITVSKGYIDSSKYMVIYRDREILGTYTIDVDSNLEDAEKLFRYFNIDLVHLNLVEEFITLVKAQELEKKTKYLKDVEKLGKWKYTQDQYTFILQDKPYSNMGDRLHIFKGVDVIGQTTLEDVLGGDKFDVEIDHNKNLKKISDKVDKKVWVLFKSEIFKENNKVFKARKEAERVKREQDQKYYSEWEKNWRGSYNFSTITGVKEEDKLIYKKFYKTLAKQCHPDVIGGDGREMQIINDLKQTWGLA